MIFVNPTDHVIKLDAIGLDPVAAKAEVEIPLSLCAPYRTDNGQRGKSPVEQVAPQLHPKNADERKAWEEIPAPPVPQSKIVANASRHLQPQPESPGVKALREKAEAAARAKAANSAPKATASPQTNANAPAAKP